MNEDNVSATDPEQREEPVLGKFKSVDALARAYTALEAEFTRRSQKLKAYEEAAGAEAAKKDEPQTSKGEAPQTSKGDDPETVKKDDPEALFRAVTENEAVRARVVNEYLRSLGGVPLMGGSGMGVTAPAKRPVNIKEAGALALGYLRGNQK